MNSKSVSLREVMANVKSVYAPGPVPVHTLDSALDSEMILDSELEQLRDAGYIRLIIGETEIYASSDGGSWELVTV